MTTTSCLLKKALNIDNSPPKPRVKKPKWGMTGPEMYSALVNLFWLLHISSTSIEVYGDISPRKLNKNRKIMMKSGLSCLNGNSFEDGVKNSTVYKELLAKEDAERKAMFEENEKKRMDREKKRRFQMIFAETATLNREILATEDKIRNERVFSLRLGKINRDRNVIDLAAALFSHILNHFIVVKDRGEYGEEKLRFPYGDSLRRDPHNNTQVRLRLLEDLGVKKVGATGRDFNRVFPSLDYRYVNNNQYNSDTIGAYCAYLAHECFVMDWEFWFRHLKESKIFPQVRNLETKTKIRSGLNNTIVAQEKTIADLECKLKSLKLSLKENIKAQETPEYIRFISDREKERQDLKARLEKERQDRKARLEREYQERQARLDEESKLVEESGLQKAIDLLKKKGMNLNAVLAAVRKGYQE